MPFVSVGEASVGAGWYSPWTSVDDSWVVDVAGVVEVVVVESPGVLVDVGAVVVVVDDVVVVEEPGVADVS
jgi:hypothetical protein